ncbi:MAG TPA: RNA 2',3'-cyclic phosphodiesterase [Bacteroidota bacterium]|nr:RNA 2',3'-cyclic phosphodiesterase [Bacteroidota bacterium]
MKGIRTFIGIFPPPEVQATISRVQHGLKKEDSAVKWEVENKFHATVKFLGDVLPGQLQELQSALTESSKTLPQFSVKLSTVGCFPDRNNPRIVWIGSNSDENAPLTECAAAVNELCVSKGFKKNDRAFHPHITLGRTKGKLSNGLIKTIENATFEPIQFFCKELLVMKSNLSPSGSAYSRLSTIPLKY